MSRFCKAPFLITQKCRKEIMLNLLKWEGQEEEEYNDDINVL